MKRTKPQRKTKQPQVPAEPSRGEDATEMFEQDDFESGDALHEAESELGISEWIDPETGDPADDSVPRIEDH